MDFEAFLATLDERRPPNDWHPLLRALWYEGNDDWDTAHDIAQDMNDAEGAWVHAYLHRVEGDRWNARYWYQRAGKPMPEYSLEQEAEELVRYFLGKN